MSIGGVRRHAWLIDPRSLRFRAALAVAFVWGALHLLLQPAGVLPVAADSAKYDALARSVAGVLHHPSTAAGLFTGRLSTAERDSLGFDRWEFQHAPGYVMPLGLLYAIFPNDVGAGRVLSLILYALSAGLLLRLADRLIGRRLSWVALALYLLYLPMLYYGLGIATEGPSAFALLLLANLLLAYHRREDDRRARLLGLGLALLYLTKTTFRPIALLLLGYEAVLLLRSGARRRALQVVIPAIAPVLLWTAILALAHVPLNPLARTGEDALWAYRGNYVPDQGWETTGMGDAITPELHDASEGLPAPGPTIEEKDFATRRTMYWRGLRLTIMRDPVGWLSLVAHKFGLFWTYPALKPRIRTVLGAWAVPRGFHLLLFPLALLGVARTLKRRGGFGIPGLVVLGVAGVHAVTHLVARYNLPVLAIAIVYALVGAKGMAGWACAAVRRARKVGLRGAAGLARWPALWLAAVLLGGLALAPPGALGPGTGRALFVAGALLFGLAPMAFAPVLLRAAPRRAPTARRRRLLLAGALLLFCLPRVGARLGERDWDEFAVHLDAPGQSLIQEIGLLDVIRGGAQAIDSAWVEIDMLRDLRGSFRLEVLAQGVPVRVFADTLDGAYDQFLFDPEIHGAGDVYRKVADTYRSFVTGRLNPRWKAASPGYDYFRRWVRVPLPPALLRTDTLRIELRLTQVEGGGIRVFGDRQLSRRSGRRTFVGPVIGENPFEFSNYRAEFLAGDRERADARLIRPRQLFSPWSRSLRRSDGRETADLDPGWRDARGELRIRLRVRVPGQLAGRLVKGRLKPVWVLTPHPGDQLLGPQDIRRFQWWRDDYFDGTRVL